MGILIHILTQPYHRYVNKYPPLRLRPYFDLKSQIPISMWYLFSLIFRDPNLIIFGPCGTYLRFFRAPSARFPSINTWWFWKKSRAPSAPLFLEFPFRKLVQKPKNFRRLRRRRVVLILMNFLRFEFFWGVLRFDHFGHQFGQIFPGGAY